MLRFAAVFLCALGACSSGSTSGVELTMRFDESVSDAQLATVRAFSIVSSGEENDTYPVSLDRAARREERIVYRSLPTSSEIGLAVTASDANGDVVASGMQAHIALDPEHATAVEITLSAQAAADLSLLGTDDGSLHMDLGVDDAMVHDAALHDAGPSGCTSTGKAVCENFESGAVGSLWTMHQTNGSVIVDTSKAHRGTYALHIKGQPADAGVLTDVRIAESTTFGTSSPPDVYVRAYYYFESAPTNAMELASMVSNKGTFPGVAALYLSSTTVATGDSVTGTTLHGTFTMPTQQWVCIEWHVHVSSTSNGGMSVAVNDMSVGGLSQNEATEADAGLNDVSVGGETYDPSTMNPAYELWIDDVIVDVAPIGCAL